MKANELRIGNYAFNTDGDIVRIVPEFINKQHFSELIGGEPIFSPIPLTEEWLVKFGFDIKKSPIHKEWWEIIKDPFYIQKKEGDDYWSTRLEYDHDSSFKAGNIKYVHQLQNLYFALTGEELTIKEL